MRATLESLKAMDNEGLHDLWCRGRFPFDNAPCDHCLTTHAELRNSKFHACHIPAHLDLVRQVSILAEPGDDAPNIYNLSKHIEELYALRLFYDSLYPPSEESPSPTVALAESCSKSEVGA